MDHQSVEVAERHSFGYSLGPPWLFKGSALYQLHLVKADVARAFIPKEFKLVQAFGYTLGGFFLAHYDDSPAGIFDELVVIAGIVWNPPTSCAWAAKVLVNSIEACKHGRKEVGLPSHVAVFSKKTNALDNPRTSRGDFLNMLGIGSDYFKQREQTEIKVSEVDGSSKLPLCNINLPYVAPKSESREKWIGPQIRLSLPSFSGQTMHNPHLLKYSCQIECRVRAVQPAKVSGLANDFNENDGSGGQPLSTADSWQQSVSVLLSKPVLALRFDLLKMQVEAPVILVPRSERETRGII